jgi:Cof subfamily protein (haloacid dehalogenase superfamily)
MSSAAGPTSASGTDGGTRVAADLIGRANGMSAGGRRSTWNPVAPEYVALDVDGTLVAGEEVPRPSVLAAITELVDAGVRVGLATGRMGAAVRRILEAAPFTGPHVTHNGALVRAADGRDLHVTGLTDTEVDAVLDVCRTRADVTVELYVGETYLTDREDPRASPHAELLRVAPTGTITSARDLDGRSAVKAVVLAFSAQAATDVAAALRGLGVDVGPAASPATPTLRYLNVTRLGVDKGSGVSAAAAAIGVDLRAVAAIGDEANDLPVLARVGTAIAMGDAHDEVRAQAHLVTRSYADHGTELALALLLAQARAAR